MFPFIKTILILSLILLIDTVYAKNPDKIEKCNTESAFKSGELETCPKNTPQCCYDLLGTHYCCEENNLIIDGLIILTSIALWVTLIVSFFYFGTEFQSEGDRDREDSDTLSEQFSGILDSVKEKKPENIKTETVAPIDGKPKTTEVSKKEKVETSKKTPKTSEQSKYSKAVSQDIQMNVIFSKTEPKRVEKDKHKPNEVKKTESREDKMGFKPKSAKYAESVQLIQQLLSDKSKVTKSPENEDKEEKQLRTTKVDFKDKSPKTAEKEDKNANSPKVTEDIKSKSPAKEKSMRERVEDMKKMLNK